jgi:glycosyltransferase involved in cell wall biosynthesis
MDERAPADQRSRFTLAVVVAFRDEEAFLPTLIASLESQTEPADEVLLVDDGSTDRSAEMAQEAAARNPYLRCISRPRQEADALDRSRDRLASAPEFRSFRWGVDHLTTSWQVVAKMDADLQLPPTLFEEIRSALAGDPSLGVVGAYLSVKREGAPVREHTPDGHVRGPNKFYRRECYFAMDPVPAILGWDTVDELKARRSGWTTYSISPRSGDIIHLRPTGSHDGRLRAYWRWGRCAWGYGAHPLGILAGAARRSTQPPRLIGGICYLAGWLGAAVSRAPRVDPGTRRFARSEDLRRIRQALRGA